MAINSTTCISLKHRPKPNHEIAAVTNAGSALRRSALRHNGTVVTLSLQSVTGIVYRVETRDDVRLGGWSALVDGFLGTGGAMQIIDPGVLALPMKLYRLGAER